MAKNITMAEIAREMNVSTVTVSKALSGQKGVSEELAEKINEQARTMGYIKERSQQGIRQGHMIGVIVAERYLAEIQSFYWKMYQELSRCAIKKKCLTLLEVISSDEEKKRSDLPKIMQEKRVESLIVMGAFNKKYLSILLEKTDIPLLFLDTMLSEGKCDAVVSNNTLGGYKMTNYLYSMGHEKIGFVGTRLATTSIDDRYLGYVKSLMEHGKKVDESWVIDDRDREGTVDINNKFVLPLHNMPTAFFCNCDFTASVLISKLRENHFHVPEDISVVGFDNYLTDEYRCFADGKITTYEIDIAEMAKHAIHTILKKMENSGYTNGVFMIPGKFVEGVSVKEIGMPVPFV